jgi:hypothetical protein
MPDQTLTPKDLGVDAEEIYLIFYWARHAHRSATGVIYRNADLAPHVCRRAA